MTVPRGVWLLIISLAGSPVLAADWHVPEAPVRIQLTLDQRGPTHRQAGYFARIPDGGVLPTPHFLTQVTTPDGRALKSALLWKNRESGAALVFEDPGKRARESVQVYVLPTARAQFWTSASGLTPSPILCADPGSGDMRTARKLAQFGTVDPTVHYDIHRGHKRAALSIGGNLSGRPRPGSFYLLAHLVSSDPGKTWVAPFTMNGTTEVVLDGEALEPTKRIDKWGGTGQWYDLDEDLHLLEVFQTAEGTTGFDTGKTGGLMYLTWRTPKATMEELGGERSKKVPMSGTSRMETRVLNKNEIVRSGVAEVQEVTSRDGHPVASAMIEPAQVYWFEGEDPVILYRLQARTAGQPEGTTYQWSFPDGAKATGRDLFWIYPGGREQRVQLTATAGTKSSTCAAPFFTYSTLRTSLNNADHRKAFRAACYDMVRAYPTGADPTRGWGESMWNNLFRVMDFGKGYPLLQHLFEERWARQRPVALTPDRLHLLQDLLLDVAPRFGAEQAAEWATRFAQSSRDPARSAALSLRRVDIEMFYLGDTNQAARLLSSMIRQPGEAGERARIRMGDLAFLGGDLNRATEFYADVQNRVRHEQRRAVEQTAKQPGVARSQAARNAARLGMRAGRPRGAGATGVDNWKLTALLDVALSENVHHQLDQGYLLEARDTLNTWERNFPLSKITGDYILAESRLYMEIGDWQRARPMLEAFCNQVDASNYLPDTAEALVECMIQLKVPKEELRKLLTTMTERLEFHPAGEHFRELLKNY